MACSMKQRLLRSVWLIVLLQLWGCSASSVFKPYPFQAKVYRTAMQTTQVEPVLKDLEDRTSSSDGLLYSLEKGRVEFVSGLYAESQKSFENALGFYNKIENKSTVSVSSYAASGASLLTNDNAKPYESYPYERVFLHQYQALNYLAQKDAQGALVEVRRANEIQKQLLKKYESKVDDAQSKSSEFSAQNYDKYFSGMEYAAGRVKNAFQNSATFYLSGLIYEMSGEDNDAYIDYRKALEINPDNVFLQRDVLRLGTKLGMPDMDKLARQLGAKANKVKSGQGQIAVLVEEGFVPEKLPIEIGIWTSNSINQLAFPFYGETPPPQAISLTVAGDIYQAAPLVDSRALAVRALKDDVPGMLLRAFLRLQAKQRMQREMRKNDQTGLLGLASSLYSLVTDKADLRSWLTLPGSVQVARVNVAVGDQVILLPDGAPISVNVKNQQTTLVYVVRVGNQVYSHVFN